MPVSRRISNTFLSRMIALADEAASRPNGITLKVGLKSEIYKVRQAFYSARRVVQLQDKYDVSPISTVETRILKKGADYYLEVMPQGTMISRFEVIDSASGEVISEKIVPDEAKYKAQFGEGTVLEVEELDLDPVEGDELGNMLKAILK